MTTLNPLKNKNIVLGVTGSIAAYKSVELASLLAQNGACVHTILTEAAQKFVSPICFQSVTAFPAYTDKDLWSDKAHVLHVNLAQKTDAMIIAPATANTIAKLTHGIADNLLTLFSMSYSSVEKSHSFIAPAMDAGMYSNIATQSNIKVLSDRGYLFIGPEEGHLASGINAKGRMTPPALIFQWLRYFLSREGPLKSKKIVVTAGGTKEPIDPVRYIGNRSSGKQGYALAQAALDAGANVILISTPTHLTVPLGVDVVLVNTAKEMQSAVINAIQDSDALIMSAAVADYTPTIQAENKIKKSHLKSLSIDLKPTPDILLSVKNYKINHANPKITIGFAAETEQLIQNALTKLREKGLDMIVANDVSSPDSGFSADTNRVAIITKDEDIHYLPLMSKSEVAQNIILKLAELLLQPDSSPNLAAEA